MPHQRRGPLALVVTVAASLIGRRDMIDHLRGGCVEATLHMASIAVSRQPFRRASAMTISAFQTGMDAIEDETRGVVIEIGRSLRKRRHCRRTNRQRQNEVAPNQQESRSFNHRLHTLRGTKIEPHPRLRMLRNKSRLDNQLCLNHSSVKDGGKLRPFQKIAARQ